MGLQTEFTITKANFLNFYFNTGDDGSQHEMRVNEGYNVVDALLEGKEYKLPDVQELFDNCGYIRMSDCEEVGEGHPLEDCDDIDVEYDINITLI